MIATPLSGNGLAGLHVLSRDGRSVTGIIDQCDRLSGNTSHLNVFLSVCNFVCGLLEGEAVNEAGHNSEQHDAADNTTNDSSDVRGCSGSLAARRARVVVDDRTVWNLIRSIEFDALDGVVLLVIMTLEASEALAFFQISITFRHALRKLLR